MMHSQQNIDLITSGGLRHTQIIHQLAQRRVQSGREFTVHLPAVPCTSTSARRTPGTVCYDKQRACTISSE